MPIKASNLKSDDQNQINEPIKNVNNLKSLSGANDKFSRLEGGEQQITVACRLRPLTEEEIIEGSSLIGHKIADDNMIVLMDPMEDHDDVLRANRSREKQFVFDMVFDAKSSQQDVYEKTTKSLLPGVLNGYNATVFAYGATGAGKTYTMLGTEQEPGIMFRTLHDLFIEISKTTNNLIYQVSMSYLEIYNELIRDLLSPSNGFLELREDAKGGVQVAGISELVAETPEEVMHMLHKGNKERTQEPTKANKTSSRSHAVLQVNIKQRDKIRQHSQEIRLGKLYMIDLAGSERAAQTQNTGKRMVEGAHINRSLLALGNCINALSEKGGSKYVNYRDSKLTRILKDSLGGNSKTVMIAHISPASIHFEESRNTLVYADRAKYIKTKPRRTVIDVSYHISQYQQIIQELAQEIATLKEQRYDLESRVSHFDTKSSLIGLNQIPNEDRSKIEEHLKLRESLLQAFKQQIKLRKNILELDNAIMDANIEAERHYKIIENWESRKETGESKKIDMPESVLNSKEELKIVEQDRDDLEIKRRDANKELDLVRARTKKLRDQASKKLTNHEQKEILNLLLKNFEFEIKNIEMQADLFKRDFKIREQDMVILRLEQHRSLCDTLIYQQRRLIIDNNLTIPQDLNELFYLYSRDINDGQLMKDLAGVRSTSNSSLSVTNSPKPNLNAFLTQIQEEKSEYSVTPIQNKHNNESGFNKAWSNFKTKDNELFQKTFQKMSPTNHNNTSKKRKSSKDSNNYYNISGNYISSNGNGGLMTIESQIPINSKKNLSNISTSTNDSNNAEIILENNSSSNRQLIKTGNFNDKSNIEPPGHVESNNGSTNNTKDAKRLTQGIAMIAAQRKASQHHRDLMQELGQDGGDYNYNNRHSLTPSRLIRHDQVINEENLYYEKKNSFINDSSNNKAKKQVKIKDIVQYKLPDDNYAEEYPLVQKKLNRRNSLESPLLYLKNDEIKKNVKTSNKKSNIDNKITKYQNNKKLNGTNGNSLSLNNINNMTSNTNNNNSQTINNKNSNHNKIPPSIPNYSKGVNLSLSGTSVLKS